MNEMSLSLQETKISVSRYFDLFLTCIAKAEDSYYLYMLISLYFQKWKRVGSTRNAIQVNVSDCKA